MLTSDQLIDHLIKLGVPKPGKELTLSAISNSPVREVKSSSKNVVTHFSSKKMGRAIATESKTAEFVAALLYEMDDEVLAYYPQPFKQKVIGKDSVTQQKISFDITPDFLVIRKDSIAVEEWKLDDQLHKLAVAKPNKFQRVGDDWRSEIVEEHFSKFGMWYQIRTPKEIHPNRVSNLYSLIDYYGDQKAGTEYASGMERVAQILNEKGRLSIAELLDPPYSISADQLYYAITNKLVACNLDSALLSDTRNFLIYRDRAFMTVYEVSNTTPEITNAGTCCLVLEPSAVFDLEGSQVSVELVLEKSIILNSIRENRSFKLDKDFFYAQFASGFIKQLSAPIVEKSPNSLLDYTSEELNEAYSKSQILSMPYEASGRAISRRTYQRCQQKQRAAEVLGGNVVLALAPNHHKKGNRNSKLIEGQADLMMWAFENIYDRAANPNVSFVYRGLCAKAIAMGVPPPSYKTFNKFVKSNSNDRTELKRLGKKNAYQKSGFYQSICYETPRHGVRPFECVHIDHTQLDICLLSRSTGKSLGKPWLTFMVDGFSRRVMAIYLSFNTPDRISVLGCLRAFVKRWKRLPQMLICDNGKDLTSDDVKSVMNIFGGDLRLRPKGEPRNGSVMERIFGTTNTQLIHNLEGNTELTKNVRSLARTHLPEKLAHWSLDNLYLVLEYWAYEYYDTAEHPALNVAPRVMFERGISQTGLRPSKTIVENREFYILTCPSPKGLTRVVDPQRGVSVNNFRYESPEFRSHELRGQALLVRFDPGDITRVFVQKPDRSWIEANCSQLASLRGLNYRQLNAISAEYRAVHKTPERWDGLSERNLREFIAMAKYSPSLEKRLCEIYESELLQFSRGLLMPDINSVDIQNRSDISKLQQSVVGPLSRGEDLIHIASIKKRSTKSVTRRQELAFGLGGSDVTEDYGEF